MFTDHRNTNVEFIRLKSRLFLILHYHSSLFRIDNRRPAAHQAILPHQANLPPRLIIRARSCLPTHPDHSDLDHLRLDCLYLDRLRHCSPHPQWTCVHWWQGFCRLMMSDLCC